MEAGRRTDDKQAREHLVLPGQLGDAGLLGQRVQVVEQRQEAGGLHGQPADAAGQVEARVHRRLAHAVPRDEPLEGGELGGCVSGMMVGNE